MLKAQPMVIKYNKNSSSPGHLKSQAVNSIVGVYQANKSQTNAF